MNTVLSDEMWNSWTLTLGWPVLGIWRGTMDGSDVNAVDRSCTQTLLATADDFGHVCLFRYPCVNTKMQYETYTGHSSHVTCVRWAAAYNRSNGKQTGVRDNYLISTGGEDKCVFQWKCTQTGLDSKPSKGGVAVATESAHAQEDDGFDLLSKAPTGGDEFTAVKVRQFARIVAFVNPNSLLMLLGLAGSHLCSHGVGRQDRRCFQGRSVQSCAWGIH
jgi:WD40 repeat protein